MRNRRYEKKIGRVFSCIILIAIILTSILLTYKPNLNKVNLGLDLQGGFEVLYQVDPLKEGDQINEAAVKATSDTIGRRINLSLIHI